jgi:hypothetical protein
MPTSLILTGIHVILAIFATTTAVYAVGWLFGAVSPSGLCGVKNLRAGSRKWGLPLLGIGICLGTGGVITSWILGSATVIGPLRILLYAVGFVIGAGLADLLYYFVAYFRIRYLLPLPVCRSGACSVFERDYTYRIGTLLGWIDPGFYNYKCRCGDEYVRLGRKFMLLEPDGSTQKYKVLRGYSKWVDDV